MAKKGQKQKMYKRKKCGVIIMSIVAAFCICFVLCACGNGYFGWNKSGHIHDHYSVAVVAPTCTKHGYTLYRCDCKDEYKDMFIAALGHLFTNYVSDNNGTCSKNRTETAACERTCCNVTDTRDIPNSKSDIHNDNGSGICSDCDVTLVYTVRY